MDGSFRENHPKNEVYPDNPNQLVNNCQVAYLIRKEIGVFDDVIGAIIWRRIVVVAGGVAGKLGHGGGAKVDAAGNYCRYEGENIRK